MSKVFVDSRRQELQDFVRQHYGAEASDLQVVSGDASFRRYFRSQTKAGSIVAVDAPPARENVQAFLQLAAALRARGVAVPDVLARDAERGYWLLQDFGDALLLPALNEHSADEHYRQAICQLLHWQQIHDLPELNLPHYDAARLQSEMQLLPEWFVARHFSATLSAEENALLQRSFEILIASAQAQPVVLVHRDFHARNLMLVEQHLGIIDFQDAVWGPLCYDIVSLLKDCYIRWPRERQLHWLLHYREQLLQANLPAGSDENEFIRWFDWMGLQRHIKVLGIFCRLNYRDGKAGYLPDLPRVLDYAIEAASLYAETRELGDWLAQRFADRLRADGSVAR